MKILVVTPTLGTSRWLPETVASVAALAFPCTHLLVAPAEAVGALRRSHPHTVVATDPGGGMYAAINAGLAAGTDWDAFTYINDDDLLRPGLASGAAAVGRAGGRPLYAYGEVDLIDAAGRRLGGIAVSRWPAQNRALYAQRLEPVYQHGTLVTRAAWEQAGQFDSALRYSGDSDYLARLCVQGVPAVNVRVTVAAFRLRAGQLTKRRPELLAERARVDKKYDLTAGPSRIRRWTARFCFRVANLPLYAERIVRHGFVSFDEMISRTG